MARRNLLDRIGTRAALPGIGAGLNNTRPVPTGSGAAGVRVGSATVQYSSPGQPMQLEWDSATAIDQAYLASLYVMRCVRCIAADISGLDIRWGIDPRRPNNFSPLAVGARLLGPALPGGISGMPNRTTSTRALVAWSLVQYLVTGRFGWEYQRDAGSNALAGVDGKGLIVGLWPLVSAYLDAVPSMDRTRWWDGFVYNLPNGPVPLLADSVFYAWRPGPKDWRQPESYISSAQLSIGIQVGIERYMNALLRHDMVAGTLVISPPFEESDMRRAFQEQFLQTFTGIDNAGNTMFAEFEPDSAVGGSAANSPKPIQIEKLSQTAVDAQLREMGSDAKDDICIALGVPRSRVGDASRRTYSNAGQEYKNYWEGTLLNICAELQDYVNTDLAPRLGDERMWFDLSRVESLRPAQIFAQIPVTDAITAGLVSVPQAQDILGVDSYDQGADVTTALEGGADFGSSPTIAAAGARSLLVRQSHRGAMNTWTYGQPEDEPAQQVRAAPALLAGSDLADKVHGYLARNYPPETLDWVHDADWTGPKAVPLSAIQMDRRPGGRDLEKVEGIADSVKAGKAMDPVVLVQAPGADRLKVADGYHRTLAHRRAGKASVMAYVGKVGDETGPWDREMHDAKLNRALPTQTGVRYDVSPLGLGKNWVTDVGGLPLFARAIAHALIRSGHSESQAIQVAIGVIQNWASGGGKVKPKTRAKAAAALAEWEAKKAASRAKPSKRDGMGVVTEGTTAGLMLPTGKPRPPHPRQAALVGPHMFSGSDVASCARCGRSAADPIHASRRRRTQTGTRHGGRTGHVRVPTGHVAGRPERHRQALAAAVATDRDTLEAPLTAALSGLFDQQSKATLSRLVGKRGKQMMTRWVKEQQTRDQSAQPDDSQPAEDDQPAPPVDVAQIFDTDFWRQKLAAALEPVYVQAGNLAMDQVGRQVELGQHFVPDSVSTDAVRQILAERADRMSAEITETTYQDLIRTLSEGASAGEPIGALTQRVQKVFADASTSRAQTIARTEVVSAMAQAADTYARDLPASVVGGKEWLAHHDDRTREHHLEADGQRRAVGEPFDVGGWPLQHPGDPTAPPEETINCRCAVAYLPASVVAASHSSGMEGTAA